MTIMKSPLTAEWKLLISSGQDIARNRQSDRHRLKKNYRKSVKADVRTQDGYKEVKGSGFTSGRTDNSHSPVLQLPLSLMFSLSSYYSYIFDKKA